MRRYAAKVDASQALIMAAIRAAGGECWWIREPCDLLVHYRGWHVLEAKPDTRRKRKDQPAQDAFLKAFSVPVVRTPTEALQAIGAVQNANQSDQESQRP